MERFVQTEVARCCGERGNRGSRIYAGLFLFALSMLVATPIQAQAESESPNILFVILDDAGIDQLTLFGNGGDVPPSTPNIDAIASEGMRFSNAWALPECSPSRSTFFTGRWGLRTGVTTALIPLMLPQAQVSPYEVTLPRLLRTAGYTSAMVGKYHLGNNNPSGSCSPATRGFDYFRGNMEAGPPAIDEQAGLTSVAPATYDCGFVRNEETGAPISGACYYPEGDCQEDLTGKQCTQSGGVLDANALCQDQAPEYVDFDRANGYYVWPETINSGALPAPSDCDTTGVGCADLTCPIASAAEPPLVRDYMSASQTDSGVEWWQEQTGPRMLTVSYNSIHTPYQQPPTDDPRSLLDKLDCEGDEVRRYVDTLPMVNAMFSSVDFEIARLLSELGLATLDASGLVDELLLDEQNTMLVIVGDNGSFAPSVRLPYDPTRAKGSVFQTGVLVPLVVAGPLVAGETGRDEGSMVNVADLFQLFAEIADIEPGEVVAPAHRLDSASMMPYLESPHATPVRQFNFAEVAGVDTLPTPVDPQNRLWPCVILGTIGNDDSGDPQVSGGFCNDLLFDTQSFCQTNSGIWFGPNTSYPNPNAAPPNTPNGAWGSCCEVIQALSNPNDPTLIAPLSSQAVHDGDFKLVDITVSDCTKPVNDPKLYPPYEQRVLRQFYDINAVPVDYLASEICSLVDTLAEVIDDAITCSDEHPTPGAPNGSACANAPACLAPFTDLAQNFSRLSAYHNGVVQSEVSCPGDGNLDKRVTQEDVNGVVAFMGSGPSYFDFDRNGQTDEKDLLIAQEELGTDCLGACRRADLNRDNLVNSVDAMLLENQFGPCNADLVAEEHLCAGDLNGDGEIGPIDLGLLEERAAASGGQPCPILVQGQNDPKVDAQAIQNAIDLAALDANGRVVLQGTFDMGGCSFCINVRGPIILEGGKNPTGEAEPGGPRIAIIANAGTSPLVVNDLSDGSGVIRIEKLWFKGGQGLALDVARLAGRVELVRNRISGYSSFVLNGADHRFGLAAAGFAPGIDYDSMPLSGGEFIAKRNYIDNRDVPFDIGDDNGISLLRCHFDYVQIINNIVNTRGESIEIESCANPEGFVKIANNEIITDAAISVRAPLTVAPRFDQPGGHPAAIKVAAAEAGRLVIADNRVRMSGWPTAVCIMPGLVNDGRNVIRDNHCSMDGQFAGLLGGWAGTPGLFGPFYLSNATIENNRFDGTSYLGIAFSDFAFTGFNPGDSQDLVNEGHDNVFSGNDMTGLSTSGPALYFGDNTHDNQYFGDPSGPVENYGSNNSFSAVPAED
jgi:arylsulfatase A-like enzyme